MKKPSMKNFSLWEIYNNNKTKYGNTIIPCVREISQINLLNCVPAGAHGITCI